MKTLAETMVVLWAIMAAALLLYTARSRRRERLLLEKLRATPLYLRLYQKLDYLFHHYDIDQVRVEQHGVTVTSVYPAHTLLNFDFKQNGNGKRCDAVSRLAAQLLSEDFAQLAQRDVYKLSRYRVYRANGKKEYGFSFTMRRRYKDQVINARSTVQLRIL